MQQEQIILKVTFQLITGDCLSVVAVLPEEKKVMQGLGQFCLIL